PTPPRHSRSLSSGSPKARPGGSRGEGRRSGESGRRPPTHLVQQRAGARVDVDAGDDETLLLVEADRARVVLVDQEIESSRRDSLRLIDKGGGERRTPRFGRNDDLVEIAGAWIDRHEAEQRAIALGDGDDRGWDELVAPALAPPFYPGCEIDLRI